jgi:hypothetical protein
MLKAVFAFWLGLGIVAIACGQSIKMLPEYGDLLEIKESGKVYRREYYFVG